MQSLSFTFFPPFFLLFAQLPFFTGASSKLAMRIHEPNRRLLHKSTKNRIFSCDIYVNLKKPCFCSNSS